MYLERAVDDEGEVLDPATEPGRDSCAAIKLIGALIENKASWPDTITPTGIPHTQPR